MSMSNAYVELVDENADEYSEYDASGMHEPNFEYESRSRPTQSEEVSVQEKGEPSVNFTYIEPLENHDIVDSERNILHFEFDRTSYDFDKLSAPPTKIPC